MNHNQENIAALCLVMPLFLSLIVNVITISMYISMKQAKEMYQETCSRLVHILEYKDNIIKEYVDKYEKTK